MDIQQLSRDVQLNCHISDARHAGNYTLCVYLLKMREFFRWEHQFDYSDKLSTDDIGHWLTERETLWHNIEDDDYSNINIAGKHYAPFDAQDINQHLLPEKLVYSGGYGIKEKPHFFLADLESKESIGDYHIYICGKEYARDLTAPPAMSQDHSIYIRRESFKRMIWERTDEWRWHKPDNAMARAIQYYDFDNDLEHALQQMTDNELNVAVLHEIGEVKAGEHLPGWQQMMSDISFTQAEIMSRAVRDHYADTLHTLPVLLESDNQASIHFYFANLSNMRKHIFPSLMTAYNRWCDSNDIDHIERIVSSSLQHWRTIAEQMLVLHRQDTEQCSDKIEALVNSSHL